MPGLCVEECASYRIGPLLYDDIVYMATTMIGYDAAAFKAMIGGRTPRQIIAANKTVEINVLEALTSAILGMSGMFVGYNAEEVDDTSVPYQKLGTNSDCEDFAIAAVALFHWLSSSECTLQTSATTPVGK